MSTHFDYQVPFNRELERPYRVKGTLIEKIDYLFSHPSLPEKHRKVFNEVKVGGSKVLLNDMGTIAVAVMNHYLQYPQQYGHKVDNIHLQLLVRMWKQVFRHTKWQSYEVDEYLSTKMKLLDVENGFIEELIRVCKEKDYIASADDMVKKRKGVGLRERKQGYSEALLFKYDQYD